MSWLERPERKSTNPANKFLQWSSNDKCFKYFDKEKEENVLVPLPLRFVILENYHTVKGWHEKSESGIYSNEVFMIGQEELVVKSFKGGLIAKGLYNNNKEVIHNAGGHYARSIYAVTDKLELINISLKGSAVSEYSNFVKEFGDDFTKSWVKVEKADERKKGSVKYSVPVFEKDKDIKDKSKLQPFANELQEYILEYMNKDDNLVSRDRSEVDKYNNSKLNEEDPPF